MSKKESAAGFFGFLTIAAFKEAQLGDGRLNDGDMIFAGFAMVACLVCVLVTAVRGM